MDWFDLPPEIVWTLGAVVTALGLATVVARVLVHRQPEKNRGELTSRIRSWWWMIALFALCLVAGRAASIAFFALVSALAFREYLHLVPPREVDSRVALLAYAAIPMQYLLVYLEWYGTFIIFIPVYMFLLLPVRMIVGGETDGFIRATATMHWGLMTTTFSLSHAAYLLVLQPRPAPRFPTHWPSAAAALAPGFGLVVLLVLLTELNDVLQYIWGKSLGKRKIVPRVSPNKTVAGFVGGVGSTIVLAGVLGPRLTPMTWPWALLAGAIIGLSGFAGDLSISMLKRDLRVKDTGTILPGHGGVLDRIDSLTYTAPLFFHYVYYLYFSARGFPGM
jgi:phosphatidate cytidylyltransferase